MRTRAGRRSDTLRDWVSGFDPPYVYLDYLLHHPDIACGRVVRLAHRERPHDASCLLFSLTSLELLCSIVDIICISSFLSFFAHFARICCECSFVPPWLPPAPIRPQRITSTGIDHRHAPLGVCAHKSEPLYGGQTARLSVGNPCHQRVQCGPLRPRLTRPSWKEL